MRVDVQVLQTMIDTMVGIPKFSYPARQGGKRPEGEFAHISLLEEYQESIPSQTIMTQDGDTTTYKIRSLARLRLRVGVVETSGLASTKIMHGWTTEAIKAQMISSGYGFVSCKPVSLEDAKLENEWEPRQGFSIELYVERAFIEVVNNITQVSVSGEFYEGDTPAYLINFTINP